MGNRWVGSTVSQAAAGAGNISLIITAPSGTGGGSSTGGPSAGRLAFIQPIISFEYQITTGWWVPW